jgi:hypothetical protein
LRNKYAGYLPFWLQIPFVRRNNAPTISIRCVMGLKKTRAFLIEREKPWWHATKDGSSGWLGGVPTGKALAFSGTSRGRRAGRAKSEAA